MPKFKTVCGVIAFVIIPIGNIIGGAVHDFTAGMMSLRHDGANLPALIRMTTGKTFYFIFSLFMIFLLLLVVAVFINIPARLIDGFWPSDALFWTAVLCIFLYYIDHRLGLSALRRHADPRHTGDLRRADV